ncbi:hypothetical protein FAVG1_11778 [Fusarium avenaceum]|nr:hypothetical protein FAVG1_11778 [Fusarium avenaceum]
MSLQTDHVRLQTVYEKLLNGIAPQIHIEEMIRDPFSDRWKEAGIFDKLRLRLWKSLPIFDMRVRDIRGAIEEMKEKLNIEPSVSLEAFSIRKTFKRAKFILQKSNYDEALTRIREGVSVLDELASSNMGLESSRKSRSDGRLHKLVKGTLDSIYHALQSAIACKCTNPHDVGLRLTPPSRTIIPDDDDEEIKKEFQFCLAVSHTPHSTASLPRQWNEIVLKRSECTANTASAQITTSPPNTLGFLTPSAMVSPMGSSQSTQTVTVQPATGNLTLSTFGTTTKSSRHISNLCETMQSIGKKKQGDSCGHIRDSRPQESLKYDICIQECLGGADEWSLVPLKQLLQYPGLFYNDKLRLAYMIACSTLQMQGTPWIARIPRSDDIYVSRKKGLLQFQHVFVLRYFPEGTQSTATTSPNIFLLYLGIILIELILGQSVTNLGSSQSQIVGTGLPRHVLDYDSAKNLLGRVMMEGGSGYHKAVECCLASSMFKIDAADGSSGFQGHTISGIIDPLEQDLRSATAVF